MKMLMAAAAIAVQFLGSETAGAASPDAYLTTQISHGTFAGARLRMPLGGKDARIVRAGLTFAPMIERERSDGSRQIRFGEGVEFGLNGHGAPNFSIAGRPLASFRSSTETPIDKQHAQGISTVGAVAIGVGVVTVIGAIVFYHALTNCPEHADEC